MPSRTSTAPALISKNDQAMVWMKDNHIGLADVFAIALQVAPFDCGEKLPGWREFGKRVEDAGFGALAD
ncbi:hypothetical protein [Polaromonas naphthalenivorans]|uniref:hypothetical protein n=1 Tax=Polaromonas naphthalenivorans TaxID=216465 RepID=UPI00059D01C5|nr:hypothetical protein [Polaromonas naphthalenivorans]